MGNNPTSLIDPFGLQCVDLGNGVIGDDGTDPPCNNVTGDTPGQYTVNGGPAPMIPCAMYDGYGCGYNSPNYYPTGSAPTLIPPSGGSGTGTPPAPSPSKSQPKVASKGPMVLTPQQQLPSCFGIFYNATADFLAPIVAPLSTTVAAVEPTSAAAGYFAYEQSLAANAAKYGFEIGSAARIAAATRSAWWWAVGDFAKATYEVSLPAAIVVGEVVGLNAEVKAVNEGACRPVF